MLPDPLGIYSFLLIYFSPVLVILNEKPLKWSLHNAIEIHVWEKEKKVT